MSREKQIEKMAKDVSEAIKHNSAVDVIRHGLICVNDDGVARELFDEGYRKQSEWISVEERVPDNGETVLTVDNEGYMIVASWYELGGWFLPVCRANPVTHWMPLPEPPDMKGGAE